MRSKSWKHSQETLQDTVTFTYVHYMSFCEAEFYLTQFSKIRLK